MAEQGVDIKTLSAAQLNVLGEQLEGELNTLSESFQSLQAAVSRFFQSGTALEALAEEAEGTAMMVPLTDSLYAPGKLGSTQKVLLDIGTGYFVEVRGCVRAVRRRGEASPNAHRPLARSSRLRTAWTSAGARSTCCARTWTSWARRVRRSAFGTAPAASADRPNAG